MVYIRSWGLFTWWWWCLVYEIDEKKIDTLRLIESPRRNGDDYTRFYHETMTVPTFLLTELVLSDLIVNILYKYTGN